LEFNLNDFGVTGFARANLLVGRVVILAASVPARHRSDALEALKDGFNTPKTATSESDALGGGLGGLSGG
jgi:hypothetical protein